MGNLKGNRGEPMGVKEIKNIDFEILDDVVGDNIADKFNVIM